MCGNYEHDEFGNHINGEENEVDEELLDDELDSENDEDDLDDEDDEESEEEPVDVTEALRLLLRPKVLRM